MKFREYHLEKIITNFNLQKAPLDVYLSHYFRENKAIGSKDRKFLSEAIYAQIRWKSLLQFVGRPLLEEEILSYAHNKEIPAHIRLSLPEELYQELVSAYGEEKAEKLSLTNNQRAPVTVRVNTLKISRDNLLKKWSSYSVSPCLKAPHGIIFHEKINFFSLPEFKEGLFEIQDEGSQLIAEMIGAKPKDHVLDFCAGAGGKTLALSPKLQGQGQIYLHDIRPHALVEARKRLNRAGIQNAQFSISAALKKRMDWILVDAPCSGSGTYRRNPDLKWKFSKEMLERIVQDQRKIFEEALIFLKPKGKIVYATCSIFPVENELQVKFFEEKFGLKTLSSFQSLPEPGEMDGFFGAVMEAK